MEICETDPQAESYVPMYQYSKYRCTVKNTGISKLRCRSLVDKERHHSSQHARALEALLADADDEVRAAAVTAVGRYYAAYHSHDMGRWMAMLADKDAEGNFIYDELVESVAPGIVGIEDRLFDDAAAVRVAAVKALPWSEDILHEIELLDPNARVRRAAAAARRILGPTRSILHLTAFWTTFWLHL